MNSIAEPSPKQCGARRKRFRIVFGPTWMRLKRMGAGCVDDAVRTGLRYAGGTTRVNRANLASCSYSLECH
jgi:hypothetical protein